MVGLQPEVLHELVGLEIALTEDSLNIQTTSHYTMQWTWCILYLADLSHGHDCKFFFIHKNQCLLTGFFFFLIEETAYRHCGQRH